MLLARGDGVLLARKNFNAAKLKSALEIGRRSSPPEPGLRESQRAGGFQFAAIQPVRTIERRLPRKIWRRENKWQVELQARRKMISDWIIFTSKDVSSIVLYVLKNKF